MSDKDDKQPVDSGEFGKLLEKDSIKIPQVGDIIKGTVVTASKSEIKLDINGVLMGIIRGPELYNEVPEYSDLKPGDTAEAAVVDTENENGELELSFRLVGQEKAWDQLRQAYRDKTSIKVKIVDANKGGLLSRYCQIDGFLPVSQLAPENYPRVSGGDKSKILEKLKSFVGQEFEVSVITLNEDDNKIIFSEKDIWNKKQQPSLDKYQVGMEVSGKITAITNFGVFVSFGENIEGLIHISELAWQRIDSPSDMYKVGDSIQAMIISIEGSKVFLSAKKLLKDPWSEVSSKYVVGQIVPGTILKVNPFGLFVKLDDEIHGLAHISQLDLDVKDKISDIFKSGELRDFEIMSISPNEHRLGLRLAASPKTGSKSKKEAIKSSQEVVLDQVSDSQTKTSTVVDDANKKVKKTKKSESEIEVKEVKPKESKKKTKTEIKESKKKTKTETKESKKKTKTEIKE